MDYGQRFGGEVLAGIPGGDSGRSNHSLQARQARQALGSLFTGSLSRWFALLVVREVLVAALPCQIAF